VGYKAIQAVEFRIAFMAVSIVPLQPAGTASTFLFGHNAHTARNHSLDRRAFSCDFSAGCR